MTTLRRLWIILLLTAAAAVMTGLSTVAPASAQPHPAQPASATVHPMTANTVTGTAPYVPVTPALAFGTNLAAGSSTTIQLTGQNGIPPVGTAHAGAGPYGGVSAIAVNLRIDSSSRDRGTVTLYPAGTARPATDPHLSGRPRG